jgi:hypothetical protein
MASGGIAKHQVTPQLRLRHRAPTGFFHVPLPDADHIGSDGKRWGLSFIVEGAGGSILDHRKPDMVGPS